MREIESVVKLQQASAMFKKNFKLFSLIQLTLLSALILSCGASTPRVGYPILGVTRRFPIPAVGREAKLKPYDFTQLEEGIGLYVFSYEIKFKRAGHEVARTSEGIRIWEHRFDGKQGDLITKAGLMPILKGKGSNLHQFSKSGPEAVALIGLSDVLTNRYGPEFDMKYQKGCIAYGGRVIIDATVEPCKIIIEQHFDEDIGPIKDYFKENLDEIEILTYPLVRTTPRLNNEWKD